MGILGGLFKPKVEKMEKNRDVGGLIEALKHKDVGVRRRAAGALGRFGDPRAVDPLIGILTDSDVVLGGESLYLQGDVARALGEIGDERALEALESAAQRSYGGILSGVSSLEEAAREAAESKRRIDYFKEAAKEALERIKAKRSQER